MRSTTYKPELYQHRAQSYQFTSPGPLKKFSIDILNENILLTIYYEADTEKLKTLCQEIRQEKGLPVQVRISEARDMPNHCRLVFDDIKDIKSLYRIIDEGNIINEEDAKDVHTALSCFETLCRIVK